MVSYAQNFEDVMLARVFAGWAPSFYVDVGAWDPEVDSVTKHFYDLGWSGVNIEPNPTHHALLAEARPRDLNVNCAIGEVDEERPFFVIDGTGCSTLDRSFSNHFADRFEIRESTVRTRTLNDVLSTAPAEFAFLKIDVEGWESQVIRSLDWKEHRPIVVVVEAVDPLGKPAWSSWEPLLNEQGFNCVYFDGLNRFYLAQERLELAEAFQTPPNVFDDFILNRERVVSEQLASQQAATQALTNAVLQFLHGIGWSGNLADEIPPGAQTLLNLREQLSQAVTSLRARYSEAVEEAAKARLWAGEVEQARAIDLAIRSRLASSGERSE